MNVPEFNLLGEIAPSNLHHSCSKFGDQTCFEFSYFVPKKVWCVYSGCVSCTSGYCKNSKQGLVKSLFIQTSL